MNKLVMAAALLGAPATLSAATPAEDNARDMRCLIVTSELADSKDKDAETAGLLAAQFFLGRLDGRAPNQDFEALLVQEAARMTEAEKGALLQACVKQLEDRNKLLEAVGNKIAAAAK